MPNYQLNHLHHETRDVDASVAFYQKVFGATSEPPFERGGATWVRVHVGDVAIMVTNRPCSDQQQRAEVLSVNAHDRRRVAVLPPARPER